jgi:hypothetical protein
LTVTTNTMMRNTLSEKQYDYIEKRPNQQQLLRSAISTSSTSSLPRHAQPDDKEEENTMSLLQFIEWDTAILESHGFDYYGNDNINPRTYSRWATLTLTCPKPNDSMLVAFMMHNDDASGVLRWMNGDDDDVVDSSPTLLFQSSQQQTSTYYWKRPLHRGQFQQEYYTPVLNSLPVQISILDVPPATGACWLELTNVVCGSSHALNSFRMEKQEEGEGGLLERRTR